MLMLHVAVSVEYTCTSLSVLRLMDISLIVRGTGISNPT
jgi:hypothetical protein